MATVVVNRLKFKLITDCIRVWQSLFKSPNPGESHEPIFKAQCGSFDADVGHRWVYNVPFFTTG
jgi:hypothetical protein